MLSILRNGAKCSVFPFLSSFLQHDRVEGSTPTEKNADMSVMKQENGWDRVKRIFEVTEFGDISHELNSIIQCATMSCVIGGIFGGTIASRNAYHEFIRNNEATTFDNHFDAKRKLQDKVTIAFGKGAFKFSWRLTLFSTSIITFTTLIQAYRGKSGIGEYAVAGGLSGFLYKFNDGPRAWLVAGCLGSALGLVCGVATWSLLKLSGMSLEETRYWQYQWRQSRDDMMKGGMSKKWDKEDFAIIKVHDQEVGEAGRNIENLDAKKNVNEENVDKNKS